MRKYVDDTKESETIQKGQQSQAQVIDHVSEWSKKNVFQLNCDCVKLQFALTSNGSPRLLLTVIHSHKQQALSY